MSRCIHGCLADNRTQNIFRRLLDRESFDLLALNRGCFGVDLLQYCVPSQRVVERRHSALLGPHHAVAFMCPPDET